MTLDELKSSLPAYAKDLRLDLESVLSEGGAPGLDPKQIALVALASAIASRHAPLTEAVARFAAQHANDQELDGARTAAALMGMTNIYYRFLHLVENDEYATLRTSLRMNAMASPGCEKIDFDLACIAVSAINGCGSCVASRTNDPGQARGVRAGGAERRARRGGDPRSGSHAGRCCRGDRECGASRLTSHPGRASRPPA